MSSTDDRLTALVHALRSPSSPSLPPWTDRNDADPGTTLVSLFAFLADQLDGSSTLLSAAARADLARIGARLVELDRSAESFDLRVDGVRWRAVTSLDDAAPDGEVFALDAERGEIRFGDGVHGRRPHDGATIAATYRQGVGHEGAIITITSTWPLTTSALTVEARQAGVIRVSARVDPPEGQHDVLERVNYFQGQLLSAGDFQAEQQYFRTKLRRLHRAALSVGVISGLELSVSEEAEATAGVRVGAGMAVDPAGELIEVHEPVTLPLGKSSSPALVLLRYLERPTAFVLAPGETPDSESAQPGRIAEGFGISIAADVDAGAVLLGTLERGPNGWLVAQLSGPP